MANLAIPRPATPRFLVPGVVLLASFLFAFVAGSHFFSVEEGSAAEASTTADVSLVVDPVISITTNAPEGKVTIPITPSADGAFNSHDLTVSVHTNNQTGYTLNMNSSSDTTALTHTSAPTSIISSTIATLASPQTLSANTWGYSKWANGQVNPPTTFSRIPASGAPDKLTETTDPSGPIDTKLTFGANASLAIPSGTYTNTITFTAVTNFVAPPAQDLGPMQKLTRANCTTDRAKAYDIRNGQYYYVQKIPGGGAGGTDLCWMESNLKYSGGGTWDSSAGYPDDRKTLTQRTTGTGDNTVAEYMDPQGNPDYTTPGPGTASVPAFYGYLYNWCAAMGGQTNACNTTSTAGFNTTISICPAGWRLPGGGAAANTPGNDFGALNNVINSGLTTSDQGLRDNWLGVYSGSYTSSLYRQGSNSSYWSSTVNSTTNSRYLNFGSAGVYPGTYYDDKNYGFAIRCVL